MRAVQMTMVALLEWRAPSRRSLQASQRALEDPRRGGGIDALGAARAAHVVVLDHAARHGGSTEALVLQHDRQRRQRGRAVLLDIGRELSHRLAARPLA